MLFPYAQMRVQMHSFDKGRTKKLNEPPTLSVGPPKKPVEVPRTLEYKTLGKSLIHIHIYIYMHVNPSGNVQRFT